MEQGHTLYKQFQNSFANQYAPLVVARNLGLKAMGYSSTMKHPLARQALGAFPLNKRY